jgi:aerobic-type carbon monoxide dehydrogenase small subunit (CoxS/CutS family)
MPVPPCWTRYGSISVSHRFQKGLRSRPVWGLHRHGRGSPCTLCLTLALIAQDQQITTIEGLSQGDKLHPMQQAFIDQDAFQCGYCTPGQIVSAIACVKEGHATNDDDIREYMSGNICRCAAYPNIVAAVKQAAPAMADEQKG